MSILGNIFSRLLGHGSNTKSSSTTPFTRPIQPKTPAAPSSGSGASTTATGTAGSATPRLDDLDIAALLDGLAARNPQKLDWRHSIVDMMKLLGMDSSLAERKELARELGYTGDMGDSAKMNIWLHKVVIEKLAANGGKVPQDLLH